MKRTWLVCALVLQVIATSVPSASAQTSVGGDIVTTPTGGRLRGTVSEYEPNVRVTIILPDGTTRTLGAGEFSSVTFADAAPAVAPQPPPPPPPTTETVAPPPTESVADPIAAPDSVERWTTSRAYRPSVESPWVNAAHALRSRRPRGDVHFGLQVDIGFLLAMEDPFARLALMPAGGAFAFLDVTVGETASLRVGALIDVTSGEGPGDAYGTFRTLGIGGRFLGGHDLSDSLIVRVGFELQAALIVNTFWLEAEGRFEIATRLLDARNLELGGAITLGTTPNVSYYGGADQGLSLPGLTFFAAWVFE